MASPHIRPKLYSLLASHRGALIRTCELHLSLIYTKDPAKCSPTAIRDYVASMSSIDNPMVQKFLLLLNNKSSSPNPRKGPSNSEAVSPLSQPRFTPSRTHTVADKQFAELLALNLLSNLPVAGICYLLYEASRQRKVPSLSMIPQTATNLRHSASSGNSIQPRPQSTCSG
jgi:hypothetical protein